MAKPTAEQTILAYATLELRDLAPTREAVGELDGQLAYVSPDATTLGRDVKMLLRGGYQFDYAQPLDMMPQTHHVHTVVRMSLR